MEGPLSLRDWYRRNVKWMILVLVVSIVGAGIALLLRYNLEHSGPLDIRGQPLEQKERQQK
jgi:hypothetical protein